MSHSAYMLMATVGYLGVLLVVTIITAKVVYRDILVKRPELRTDGTERPTWVVDVDEEETSMASIAREASALGREDFRKWNTSFASACGHIPSSVFKKRHFDHLLSLSRSSRK